MGVSVRKQFGQNICRLRTELGMTQEELCGKAEIDRSYLQRIENGGSSPTSKSRAGCEKLSSAIGTNCCRDSIDLLKKRFP